MENKCLVYIISNKYILLLNILKLTFKWQLYILIINNNEINFYYKSNYE